MDAAHDRIARWSTDGRRPQPGARPRAAERTVSPAPGLKELKLGLRAKARAAAEPPRPVDDFRKTLEEANRVSGLAYEYGYDDEALQAEGRAINRAVVDPLAVGGKKVVKGAVDRGKEIVHGAVDTGNQVVGGVVDAGKAVWYGLFGKARGPFRALTEVPLV